LLLPAVAAALDVSAVAAALADLEQTHHLILALPSPLL
jgi:hypothetical protein